LTLSQSLSTKEFTMKRFLLNLLCGAALLSAGASMAQAVVGQAAPAFSATDTAGKTVALADFKGKYVVLEWTNPGCPFVQKHYNSGNMPATQKEAMAKGAVWLAVNTTAKDASDYMAPAELQAWVKSKHAAPTAMLMDADAKVGRAYGARTTPHMYVIDPQGKLIYAGAIDSKPSTDPADIKTATNYVTQALGEAMAGKPVSRATTQAYGCSVKYSNAG
jgi:peroxiredoxin